MNVAIKNAHHKRENTEELKKRRSDHLKMDTSQRREYYMKKGTSILYPDQSCSIIMDGEDKSAFGRPHFVVKMKNERDHSLKVLLLGILELRTVNMLHLFTMMEEHETGSNNVIGALHRFLTECVISGALPPKLYMQFDNCTRENKNRLLFAYLERLIAWRLFTEIEVGFVPISHTHEDIDQAFSKTFNRLRSNEASTRSDLHSELRDTYEGNVKVSRINSTLTGLSYANRRAFFAVYQPSSITDILFSVYPLEMR